MYTCVNTLPCVHVLGNRDGMYIGDIINLLLILCPEFLAQ